MVELVLDHWADEGDDGGVDVVDRSVLGDFLVEVRVQKDNKSVLLGSVKLIYFKKLECKSCFCLQFGVLSLEER